jgi:hypothetical protein
MTQREINRAVADVTGEDPRTVAAFGFQLVDRPALILDPDTLEVYSPGDFEMEHVA